MTCRPMNGPSAPLAALLTTAFLLAAADASATNFTLWIHGRNTSQSTQVGNYADFTYWGPSSVSAGVNKKAVNWDGVSRLSDSNGSIRNALDCFCTGSNFCYIAAHSTGDPQIGYALSLFGGSTRNVKNAVAGSNGVCGNTGATQVGWNVKWIDIGGGAAGGTELANIGAWAVSDPITSDLKTGTIRSMYNHNTTGNAWFYTFSGAKGTLYSGTLPGQDDEVIAYHSSGGISATGSFCNPGNFFCDGTLNTGTANTSNGVAHWGFHTTQFRDDNESFDHYTSGSWAGIMSVVRQDVVSFAL
jgi:hypothetical protein